MSQASSFDSKEDLYAILGIRPGAEDVVVAGAYRALAQRYHPDKWKGDPAEGHRRMAEINKAYEILGHKERRANYDRTRTRGEARAERTSRPTFEESGPTGARSSSTSTASAQTAAAGGSASNRVRGPGGRFWYWVLFFTFGGGFVASKHPHPGQGWLVAMLQAEVGIFLTGCIVWFAVFAARKAWSLASGPRQVATVGRRAAIGTGVVFLAVIAVILLSSRMTLQQTSTQIKPLDFQPNPPLDFQPNPPLDFQPNPSTRLQFGKGVPQPSDASDELKRERERAERGSVNAQINVGIAYVNGRDVAQDYVEAMKWYQRAADQGDPEAQYMISVMHYNGWGVPRNHFEAYKWLKLAVSRYPLSYVARGAKGASELLNTVQAEMTPVQAAEAQKFLDEWLPAITQ